MTTTPNITSTWANMFGLWDMLRKACRMVVEPALTAYFLFRSPVTPADAKFQIAGALVDLMPLDLIPDLAPGSWLDAYASFIDILKVVQYNMTPEVEQKVLLKLHALRLA